MHKNQAPLWLQWAREIQALSQTGMHYAVNQFQRDRYQRLAEIAAEIIEEHTVLDSDIVNKIFLGQNGYATPRIDVRAAVFQDGRIMLVRERMDGGWCMPGGWADVGDLPSEAAEREVLEEAGFQVKARKVIGVYDANRTGPLELFHAFKIVFLCDLIDGQARSSDETSDVAFFSQDELPMNLSGERTKSRQLEDAFACIHDPQGPTVFD